MSPVTESFFLSLCFLCIYSLYRRRTEKYAIVMILLPSSSTSPMCMYFFLSLIFCSRVSLFSSLITCEPYHGTIKINENKDLSSKYSDIYIKPFEIRCANIRFGIIKFNVDCEDILVQEMELEMRLKVENTTYDI